MSSFGRASAIAGAITCATFGALAAPPPVATHVCADGEATANPCAAGSVRMCMPSGAFAACVCPPGSVLKKGACALDASAAFPPSCVVPDTKIAAALDAELDFGALEVPALPTIATGNPTDVVASLGTPEAKVATLGADDLVKLAAAYASIEGAAAFQAAQLPAPKAAAYVAQRDLALTRSIDARKSFVVRFAADPRLSVERIALARALLRRAAYTGVGASVAIDRSAAETLLVAVVTDAPSTTPARTAAFVLGESATRDHDWPKVLAREADVIKWAMPKTDADDHAYIAAAYARLAEAKLAIGDANGAKTALTDAITSGLDCAPRGECVSASAGARDVLAATWATTGSAARSMLPILLVGKMPKQERVRPLVVLAARYAAAAGTACASAAEEARAFAQITK